MIKDSKIRVVIPGAEWDFEVREYEKVFCFFNNEKKIILR